MGITKAEQTVLYCKHYLVLNQKSIRSALPDSPPFHPKSRPWSRYTSIGNCLEPRLTIRLNFPLHSRLYLICWNPVEGVLWLELGVWERKRVFFPPGALVSDVPEKWMHSYLKSTLSYKQSRHQEALRTRNYRGTTGQQVSLRAHTPFFSTSKWIV